MEKHITKPKITFAELKNEIAMISKRYRIKEDAAFVFWFLNAYLIDQEKLALQSLTGSVSDKNVDGIYIDFKAEQCNIIQAKYHIKEGKSEKRNDILSFCKIAELVWERKSIIEEFYSELDPTVLKKINEVIYYTKKKKFKLNLFYVTTGKCSKTIINEVTEKMKYIPGNCQIHIYPYERILHIYRNYIEGIVPAIPTMSLRLSSEGRIQYDGVIHRLDPEKGVESWVLSVSGNDVGNMFEKAGTRLFAKNIRGFLGATDINESMLDTIKEEPHNFWYYNNGVTIVCDDVKRETKGSSDLLLIEGAQVINGQQTTRILSKSKKGDTNVIVKVIKVPRNWNHDGEYDNLVNSIVRATNWQNFIKPSDLVSNDYIQVYLEREFRKKGYQYLRKRMFKKEARADYGQGYYQISKEELAQAVAATMFDPVVVRKGKERLFDDPYYKSVFSSHDIYFYLTRYWLMRKVQHTAKGYPKRAYAKWLVLHFLWKQIGDKLSAAKLSKKFIHTCDAYTYYDLEKIYKTLITHIYRASIRFYNINKGQGEEAYDESTFFQLTKLHEKFSDYWYSNDNRSRRPYENCQNKLLEYLKNLEINE